MDSFRGREVFFPPYFTRDDEFRRGAARVMFSAVLMAGTDTSCFCCTACWRFSGASLSPFPGVG